MARAIAICTCETCGTKFEVVRRDCYNRKAADDFERWAVEHICECSECEKKRIAAERAAQAKEMGWPELQGSPKQIAWAMGLRGDFYRYFRKNLEMYAAGSKDRIEKRSVSVGSYDEETDTYEITAGLAPSDRIAFPSEGIHAGMKAADPGYASEPAEAMPEGEMIDYSDEAVPAEYPEAELIGEAEIAG